MRASWFQRLRLSIGLAYLNVLSEAREILGATGQDSKQRTIESTKMSPPSSKPKRQPRKCADGDGLTVCWLQDSTGWRVQLHLHRDGNCSRLEGHVRFTTREAAQEHGEWLLLGLDNVIGVTNHFHAANETSN